MSQNAPERQDLDPSKVQDVENPEEAPDLIDTTESLPEDGEQDVSQDAEFEEAESDETDAVEDPAVREVN